MRKSTESLDDIEVPPGVFGIARIVYALTEQADRKPLVLDFLGVFKRQIAEQAVVVRRIGLVVTPGENLACHNARLGVVCEAPSGASEDISGNLVEKNA